MTAGNSCGINDGAAVVAMVDSSTWQRLDRPGLRILAVATTGVDPRLPGRGLVPAVRLALRRAGLELDDVDVIEFNEAFAGQILACCDELGLDEHGCVSRVARSPSGIRGARRVRCWWCGCSPSWSAGVVAGSASRPSPRVADRAWRWWWKRAGDQARRG